MHSDVFTMHPTGSILEVQDPKVSKEERESLTAELETIVDEGITQRNNFDRNLMLWTNLYEQRTFGRNTPWPEASDVFVPLIPSIFDTVMSRILQDVMPQRLLTVRGRTSPAAEAQWSVEQWYNKQVSDNEWDRAVVNTLFLSGRDGTGILETVWEYKEHWMKALVYEPVFIDGVQKFDENMQPLKQATVKEVKVIEFNNARWNAVELRDFYLFPAWSRSIEEAPMVGRVVYFTEPQLRSMVKTGDMIKEEVEFIIARYEGDELPGAYEDSAGDEDYSLGGQIEVTPLSNPSDPHRKGSYYKFWRLHTNMFAFPKNASPQELVIWYHRGTHRVTGIHAAKYLHGKRPFSKMCIMPRPNRPFGWGICERLVSLQLQANATHNQKNDQIDIRLSPPMYEVAGTRALKENVGWAPMQKFIVQNKDDVGIIQPPEVLTSSWQEEQQLFSYAQLMLGLSDPAISSSARGKQAAQLLQTFISVRIAMMANQVRDTIRDAFWQTHQLEIQYGPDSSTFNTKTPAGSKMLTVTKEMLTQDFELGVNGQGSPLDKGAKRQETLFMYNLFMENPLVKSNMSHIYALSRSTLEIFDEVMFESIIGTPDEAVKMQQAIQQAQEHEQKMRELELQAKVMYARAEGGAPARAAARPRGPQQIVGGTEGAPTLQVGAR